MKRLLAVLAAGTAATLAAPSASAQLLQSILGINTIDQRQASLDQRIDVGVRNGGLTASEAAQLRREWSEVARIEAQYRRTGGLSSSESRDLDHRLDILAQRIDYQIRDNDQRRYGNWQSIDQRQDNLYRRIDQGVRSGDLTRSEADRLRRDFAALNRLEAQYRMSGGLSLTERRDLDRRFDQLAARIRDERRDNDERYTDWRSINQRQADLYARIDAGVRSGDLSSYEASRLRRDFAQLNDMEYQYRRTGNGLTADERRDLDSRFDQLSARIRYERSDYDRG